MEHRRRVGRVGTYPKSVFTKEEVMGRSTVDGVSAKAASWNGP
jgi:hypothetical protein